MAMRSRCVRIPETLDKQLVQVANKMDVNVSEIVKEALFRFFQTEQEVSVIESVIEDNIQSSDARIEQMVTAKLKDAEDKIVARIIKRFNEMVITQ